MMEAKIQNTEYFIGRILENYSQNAIALNYIVETFRDQLKESRAEYEVANEWIHSVRALVNAQSEDAIHDIRQLIDKLAKAVKVISIVERLRDPRCEDFHHVKGDRHHGDKCSIVTGYEEALKEYRGEETK